MIPVTITDAIKSRCPNIILGCIKATITNTPSNDQLWQEIVAAQDFIRNNFEISDINKRAAIKATRNLYKACGKDPNRYRPAAEALNRRILKGQELYQVSTAVDITNLVSMKSGYSIGGFDFDKIEGAVNYGIGEANEAYQGIGRGTLNVEGLPILRDSKGGIGTPTSDEVRTMLSLETKTMLFNLNGFTGECDAFHANLNWAKSLLKKYVDAKDLEIKIIQ